jgi:hypothetical protein
LARLLQSHRRAAKATAANQYNDKVIAEYLTEGPSASPDVYNKMPDELKAAWLKNAPAEIKADYAAFGEQGFLAQPRQRRLDAMKQFIQESAANPFVPAQTRTQNQCSL